MFTDKSKYALCLRLGLGWSRVKPPMWVVGESSRIVETAFLPLAIAVDETCHALAKQLAPSLHLSYQCKGLSGASSAANWWGFTP
jgi:hypothetical protein